MKDKLAVVTGGTRGIGAAISEELLAQGAKVIAVYGGNAAAAKEFAAKHKVEILQCNVSDAAECLEKLSNDKEVDILVNNAGIVRDRTLLKMSDEEWNQVIDTNLSSLYNVTKAVLSGMVKRGFGRIINVSSVNGLMGARGQTNYSAAKAGMIGFSRSLALEVARKGITVNCVAPGYIRTEMLEAVPQEVLDKITAQIPVMRLGEAKEIARAVSFLAANDAGFITGSTLSVNGGQLMS